jgi:hypothetical protein
MNQSQAQKKTCLNRSNLLTVTSNSLNESQYDSNSLKTGSVRVTVRLYRTSLKFIKIQSQARMGATLDPFASPEARKSIEELQVWTGLEEDFLDIVPNAVSG